MTTCIRYKAMPADPTSYGKLNTGSQSHGVSTGQKHDKQLRSAERRLPPLSNTTFISHKPSHLRRLLREHSNANTPSINRTINPFAIVLPIASKYVHQTHSHSKHPAHHDTCEVARTGVTGISRYVFPRCIRHTITAHSEWGRGGGGG